jgi:nucleolar protein 16
LNHATGGTEKTIALLGLNDAKSSRADIAADTGAILRVIGGQEKPANPLNDPLNELDDDETEEWNGFAMVPEQREHEKVNPVIQELEEAAKNGARKAPRTQSQLEQEWLERLVAKHGEDYGRMAMDRKLNPMQQTAADIKKRVKKWRASQAKA